MTHRAVTVLLTALLVAVVAQLMLGRGSLPKVAQMQRQLLAQTAANEQSRHVNEALAAEVRDLKEGLETVEERARMELGMVRPNEIFVQLSR